MTVKKLMKMIGLFFLGLTVLLVGGGFLFIKLSPEFGGKLSAEQLEAYQSLDHFEDGKFVNLVSTSMDMSAGQMVSLLGEFIRGVPNGAPDTPLAVLKLDPAEITRRPDTLTRVTWFGHSAVLLEMDGQNILLDPMLGPVPAPHPWLGSQRFTESLPLTIEQLPAIDAVLISHDHYDHLDYGSIQQLKEKTRHFYVPLGVGAHLRAWGIADSAIHELDWWDTASFNTVQLVFAPTRHFSGRGLTDRNATLWGSWVVEGARHKLYFSGDGGYGPHFSEIGERYGPFDLAMIECGQYNKKWAQIHMMPEESAQAAVDLRAYRMMPIHWGTFRLALHSWTDPADRVTVAAKALSVPITTPRIGEVVTLNDDIWPQQSWWAE